MWKQLWLTFVLAGPAVAQEVTLRETPGELVLSGAAMELRLDRASGQVAELSHRPSGLRLLAGSRLSRVEILAGNAWVGGDGGVARGKEPAWRYVDHGLETTERGKRLWVRSRSGDWEVVGYYALDARGDLLARSATFRYLGKGRPTVRGTRFALCSASCGMGPDSFYEILSRWPPERFPAAGLVEGRLRHGTEPGKTAGFVGFHDRRRRLSLVTAFYSESEWADLSVVEHKDGIDVIHEHQVLDRPGPQQAVSTGTQYLRVVEGNWGQALAACQDLYARIGVRVPPGIAARGARSVVYSCHPGGTIESGFADVGHIRRLQESLPRLERLGINVVWLLPFYEGQVYAPLHYDRFDPRWADEESLRRFSEEAHRRGIKVLLDLIPHGPLPESGLQNVHRDWVSTTEDGRMLLWWGCLGCDYAHPGWQRFMAEHAADWVRRCDIDGYRVDCAGGGPPNWAAAGGRRPSQSGLYGAAGLLRQSRLAMEQVKRPIFLLAEAEGVPLNTTCEYTYPWTWVFQVLPALHSMPPEQWVPQALHWLQNQKYTQPEGANVIWFLENHDTPRARLLWGPGTEKALLAFCALARGAAFLYQEQQVGFEPMLRKLYSLRRSYPSLTIGTADYVPLADDPRVLTIVRRYQGEIILAAVNFSGDAVKTRFRIPQRLLSAAEAAGQPADYGWKELVSEPPIGMSLDAALPMAPWSCAVLLLEKGVPATAATRKPPADDAGIGSPIETRARGPVVILGNDRVRLAADGSRGGLIESLEFRGRRASWIAGHDLVEGPEKLGPGRTSLRLSTVSFGAPVIEPAGRPAAAGFQAKLDDLFQASVHYTLNEQSRIAATIRLTPLADIVESRARLSTTLRFPLASAWAVRTVEGVLYDAHTAWRFDDVPRTGRYWHATTDRYWESRLLPLGPDAGDAAAIFVADTARNEYLGIRAIASDPQMPRNVVLKERDGEVAQLTLRVEWLDGSRAVTLRRGDRYDLTLVFSFGTGRPWETPPPVPAPTGPALSAGYGNLEVSNDHYRIVLGRSLGGTIRSLRLKGQDHPIIDQSTIYTDYGLYENWRDPLGGEHRTCAQSREDYEPDVELQRQGDQLRVGFTGYFRQPGDIGASILEPRTQYRLNYTFDGSPEIRVDASVRPYMTVSEARAFLAHTLGLPRAGRWAVWSKQGGVLGTFAALSGDRAWQSATTPLADPTLAIETPGACCRFSRITASPPLENLFVLGGGQQATLFFAWLDGQPAAIRPLFRRLTYVITLLPGTLEQAVSCQGKLKPWPPHPEK
jgi:glycosidase